MAGQVVHGIEVIQTQHIQRRLCNWFLLDFFIIAPSSSMLICCWTTFYSRQESKFTYRSPSDDSICLSTRRSDWKKNRSQFITCLTARLYTHWRPEPKLTLQCPPAMMILANNLLGVYLDKWIYWSAESIECAVFWQHLKRERFALVGFLHGTSNNILLL